MHLKFRMELVNNVCQISIVFSFFNHPELCNKSRTVPCRPMGINRNEFAASLNLNGISFFRFTLCRQSCNLNTEQREVLEAVSRHNVSICGSAGARRTFTVKKLVKLFSISRNVAVACTTGIASGLYDNALTVHSFVGSKSSRMDVDVAVRSIKDREECYNGWQTANVLVIYEVSQ